LNLRSTSVSGPTDRNRHGSSVPWQLNRFAILSAITRGGIAVNMVRPSRERSQGNSMGPRVDSVPSDEALPTRVDVVIVGGGIIGTSRALFWARKGVSVALCEKGHIAHEQSSRNWGWCRKMARDARELPLAIESLRIWEGMNEMVGAETGF